MPIAGLILMAWLADVAEAASSSTPHSIPLADKARFRFGDDLTFAEPDYDDTDWNQVVVPRCWFAGMDPFGTQLSGWYRFRILLPNAASTWNSPAICVGVISDSAEVYFNGIKIGGQGWMLPDHDGLPLDPLVIDIPPEILRADRDNTIAIRVHRTLLDGGIVMGPLMIGERSVLNARIRSSLQRAWYIEGFLLCFLSIVVCYCTLLLIVGVREPVYRWLAVCVLLLLCGYVLDSRLYHQMFGPSALRRTFSCWLIVMLPAVTHEFVVACFGLADSRWARIARLFLCAVLFLLAPWPLAFTFLYLGWTLYVAVLLVTWLYWSVRAVMSGAPDAVPMLVGFTTIFLSILADAAGVGYSVRLGGQYLSSLSVILFFACGMIAMTQRFQRARIQAKTATASILTAHEQERKRVARELHDGVVQSLLAVQLNLQMMDRAMKDGESLAADALDRAVNEIRTAGDELRRVSHDLRPEALERLSLADAIQLHADHLKQSVSLRIDVQTDMTEEIAPYIKDHLYRIYQEALLNAIKHADATQVTIRLQQLGSGITMIVQDDGCGMRVSRRNSTETGVGMTTIRERAELLGGTARFATSSSGTQIHIDIPIDRNQS